MTQPTLAPISSSADLLERWRFMLEPPRFGRRSLWLAWFDDGVQLPLVIPVDDVPDVPDSQLISGVLHLNDVVSEEKIVGTGHLAMALCRPGRAVVTDDDDEWTELFYEVLEDQLGAAWSLHLAAGGHVIALRDAPAWV